MDKAVSASYEYLVGKLGAMFPQMRAGSFSLTWADSDGDKVSALYEVIDIALFYRKYRKLKLSHFNRTD